MKPIVKKVWTCDDQCSLSFCTKTDRREYCNKGIQIKNRCRPVVVTIKEGHDE